MTRPPFALVAAAALTGAALLGSAIHRVEQLLGPHHITPQGARPAQQAAGNNQ